MNPPEALKEIAKKLKEDPTYQHLPLTVRSLLRLYSSERRGASVVQQIRESLATMGVQTEPDFENTWIDSPIRIALIPKAPKSNDIADAKMTEVRVGSKDTQAEEDPTFRVGRLQSVCRSLIWVKPDHTVAAAATLMMQHQFSQVPVMTSMREVKGMITWRSIGAQFAFGKGTSKATEVMQKHFEIREEASIFEAMPGIIEHGYALIRGEDNSIQGILTVGGLGLEFKSMTEPFLLLQEIEKYLRRILERVPKETFFDKSRNILKSSGDGEAVSDIAEMSLGDYLRLLENPDFWDLLELKFDRNAFVLELHKVRIIRNNVMHFDEDGLKEEDRLCLRNSSAFFQAMSGLLLVPPAARKASSVRA